MLQTSALALSVAAAEYAAPVWNVSTHAKQVDITVNEAVQIVTGCLKPTPNEKMYPFVGIAPPKIRRGAASDVGRTKQENDPRHPLYGYELQTR